MENLRQETVDTYNHSARAFADYYKERGPRVTYINKAFEFAGNPGHAKVVEIGCGYGRDAEAIVARGASYLGIDMAEEFIKMARKNVPEANFEVADAATFEYPPDLDIVFAFASLLHMDRVEVKTVLEKVQKALNPGGVFYISLKWQPRYEKKVQRDQFGTRIFYFYNAELIQELAGDAYETAATWRETHRGADWFEIALKKL